MSNLQNILIGETEVSRSANDDDPIDRSSQKRPAPRGTASYPRKRAVTACQVCRARRTKCDNLKPACSFCLKVGATCIQSSVDLSSFDPASLKILERLDELEQLIRSGHGSHQTVTPAAPERDDPATFTLREHDLLPCSPEELLARPEFASVTTFGQSPSLYQHHTPQLPVASPGWEDDLTAASTTTLLDNFFNNVHVKNPVLDESQTRRMVLRLALHGFDQSPQSCLTLLVCALGSVSSTFGVDSSYSRTSPEFMTAMSYFQAANKRLGPLMVDGGLIAAQCLFLSGVLMATTFRASSAWRYFLQALACCQDFKIVKWPDTVAADVDESQTIAAEQAVYWSAWKSEREMRGDMKPFDFTIRNNLSYPSFFPTPPALSADAANSEDPVASRQRISWYFYLSEISLKRLASRIQQEIIETEVKSGQKTLEALAELEVGWLREAEIWLENLPSELSLQSTPESDDVCKFVLRGHLLNIYELIYWPFVMAGLNASERKLQVTPVTLDLANKGLRMHLERLVVNQPGFYHRHHGTMGMVRTCSRSAMVLTLAMRNMQSQSSISLTLPDGWRYHVRQTAALNRFWQNDDPIFMEWGNVLEASCLAESEP
ncbi:hypothetical protein AUEXF2481DRAFT_422292 [Aureobasidium subglaciale EXF-2481]|uniref:Zn(2)-C6 fungal-type domain-containing protein n=1 Tax=Aureobasidium subglaciale (strain EXF-2481) TaxID=1043005 RepID=A0A074Y491_AURSE|nr:uncharacterized protein AUEXF2481DRAFT_422292 [Aureobasidium subglaciale EXF-2481]KEQ92530.1 hypothetical protein AUEXF2481DRAFT_422292 [Aureobasidium subglaciale EXF-2481]